MVGMLFLPSADNKPSPSLSPQILIQIIVRQGQKDVTREQIWALTEYCQFRVSDNFEAAMESGDSRVRKAAVAKHLNQQRFEAFLEGFRGEMITADPAYKEAWRDMKSLFHSV